MKCRHCHRAAICSCGLCSTHCHEFCPGASCEGHSVASEPYPTPCIHSPDGVELCGDCLEQFEIDPAAYDEFGDHPEGLRRWNQEREAMAKFYAEMEAQPRYEPEPDLPF